MRVLFLLIIALVTAGCRESHPEEKAFALVREAGLFLALALAEYFNTPDAAGNIPCDDALHILDASEHPVLATVLGLYETQGKQDDWTCVKRFIARNAHRSHTVQIYLYYSQTEQPTLSQLEYRAHLAKFVLSTISEPTTEVRYVLALEDRLGDKFETFAQALERILGQPIARNPLDHSAAAIGREKEAHGRGALCTDDVTIGNQDGFYFTADETLAWAAQNAECSTLLIVQPEWQDLCVDGLVFRKCVPLSERQPHFEDVELWSHVIHELSLQ